MELEPIPTHWRGFALCGLQHKPPAMPTQDWVNQWHPTSSNGNGNTAKKICEACPARVPCLEQSLDDAIGMPRGHRLKGIRGKIGGGIRRELIRARESSPDPHRWIRDCECAYCTKMAAVVIGGGSAGRTINRNTAGAKCGRMSTYSRGCRCTACIAESSLQHRVKRCAEDLVAA